MFDNIFIQADLTVANSLLTAVGVSLLCGLIIAIVYAIGAEKPSRYMMISLVVMPAVVHSVIMLVNGSLGAGVAVAGAFSLIRFRSIPGNSRDICTIFLAMAAGIASGMGYLGYAVTLTILIGLIIAAADAVFKFGRRSNLKQLKIVIPEDMDYINAFDDIFKEYLTRSDLTTVKTIRMGTMYELCYIVAEKDPKKEKEMIDKIRCRNGNLPISCGIIPDSHLEL